MAAMFFVTSANAQEHTGTFDPSKVKGPATGLDVPAATAEIDRLLVTWHATPTPSQPRRLAALFLAGGEPVSALVQWLRLPKAERRTGDGMDSILVAALNDRSGGRRKGSEDTMIAAPLAAALGLERVHSMDDHTAMALLQTRKLTMKLSERRGTIRQLPGT